MTDKNMFEVKSVDEMAVFVHELYLSFLRAGFTDERAFNLVSNYFVAMATAAGKASGDDR